MAVGPQGACAYLANLALAVDLAFNAALGGSAHQTFSARSWQARWRGKRWGRVSVAIVDGIAGAGHCRRACEREVIVLTALATAETLI